MAHLMNGYMELCIREMENQLYIAIVKNELPVNIIITYLAELHKNNGRLVYGTGKFPLGISNSVNKDWEKSLLKVPKDMYNLWYNAL